MNGKIAIEKGLKPVKDMLSKEGYKVSEFSNSQMSEGTYFNKFDAVIITGEDKNIMGIEDSVTKTPVISADGMSPEQIKQQIESTIQ